MVTWLTMLSSLLLEHCTRETFRNCWRNATLWGCLTGNMLATHPSFYVSAAQVNFLYHFFSIATLAVAQNMRELYRLVLVDTPLAPYFSECITSEVYCSFSYLVYIFFVLFILKQINTAICRIWMIWTLRLWETLFIRHILRIFTSSAGYVFCW